MDKDLSIQLLSGKDFLNHMFEVTKDNKYYEELGKVNEMLNPTTRRENAIFEDYADVMEELNNPEDDNEYLRQIHFDTNPDEE